MKLFLVRIGGREEGPYSEAQVAQMFADGRIDRQTGCKPEAGGVWRTIDEYLPTLKYGTQLPPPSALSIQRKAGSAPSSPTTPSSLEAVVVRDIDVPFPSVFKMVLKVIGSLLIIWTALFIVAMILWAILMLLFAGAIGGAFSDNDSRKGDSHGGPRRAACGFCLATGTIIDEIRRP